jgi:hypothetical protein
MNSDSACNYESWHSLTNGIMEIFASELPAYKRPHMHINWSIAGIRDGFGDKDPNFGDGLGPGGAVEQRLVSSE